MSTITAHASVAIALGAWLALAACGSPASTPSPSPADTPAASPTTSPSPADTPAPPTTSPSPLPTNSPPTGVSSAAQAAALVLASQPLFAGVGPLNLELIGQCCWYEALETGDGFEVTVELGWGDCPSGCIDRHRWVFAVGRDGSLRSVDESGSTIDETQLPQPGSGPARLIASLTAGPVCPVETNPPDPGCAPRPVAGAEIAVRAPDGSEAARATSDGNGLADIQLAGGAYYVEALPAEGLLGTPEPIAFAVPAGGEVHVSLVYDTGIR